MTVGSEASNGNEALARCYCYGALDFPSHTCEHSKSSKFEDNRSHVNVQSDADNHSVEVITSRRLR